MNEPSPQFDYRIIEADGIDAIQPMWEKLKAYHSRLSWRFARDMRHLTFDPRKQEFLAKAVAGKFRLDVASAISDLTDIAYCISSASADGRGEIDSIFVEESFRGRGVGTELLRRALAWLDDVGVSSKFVTVAHGNEDAIALYRRFGFYHRTVLLQQDPAR
jgi:ribosomal protein S18 acetylase RimI-like enzyme